MEEDNATEVLAIHNLTKAFGDTVALDKVDFTLFAGEVHSLRVSNEPDLSHSRSPAR